MLASVLPIPSRPDMLQVEPSGPYDRRVTINDLFNRQEVLKYQKTRWWRNLNRWMSLTGVCVVAAVVRAQTTFELSESEQPNLAVDCMRNHCHEIVYLTTTRKPSETCTNTTLITSRKNYINAKRRARRQARPLQRIALDSRTYLTNMFHV